MSGLKTSDRRRRFAFRKRRREAHALSVYPESHGITSNWMYHAVQKIFKTGILEKLSDPLAENILKKYNLPTLATALVWIHAPLREKDALAARKRFAFEEVFFIQLQKQKERRECQDKKAFEIDKKPEDVAGFVSRFPFETDGRKEPAIEKILADFRTGHPMSRLLEGDVGSGKTAVAAANWFTPPSRQDLTARKLRSTPSRIYGPTEILAKQHFESFIKYFPHCLSTSRSSPEATAENFRQR